MRALVIDTTPLVDLRKASALPLLTRLPFELVTTDFVFGELREFSPDVPIPLWVRLALLPPQLLQRRALAQAQLLVHRREVLRHPAHVPVPAGKPSVQPLAQLLRIRIRRAAALHAGHRRARQQLVHRPRRRARTRGRPPVANNRTRATSTVPLRSHSSLSSPWASRTPSR